MHHRENPKKKGNVSMKKKNFITLVLGVIGGLLFALGMCMCLLPEWNSFTEGVTVTAIGGIVLISLFLYRFITDGRKISINPKLVGKIAFGILGVLVLGTGMCMIMVWNMLVPGILIGITGIVLLLCLIPMCIGIK